MRLRTFLVLGVGVFVGVMVGGCSGEVRAPSSLGGPITRAELVHLLVAHPDWSATGPVVDSTYQLVPLAFVDSLPRVGGADCDDYAAEAWRSALRVSRGRPAFGMVVISSLDKSDHALNFFVDEARELWLYEPQTGRRRKPTREEMWSASYYWL